MPHDPAPVVAAHTLRCEECGGGFELTALADRVTCPFCGHRQAVAPALLERLAAYHDRVRRHEDAIDEQQRIVDSWERWYGRMRRGSPRKTALMIAAFMALPTLAGLGLWALLAALGDAGQRWMPAVSVVVMVVAYGSIGGWWLWMYSARRRGDAGVRVRAAGLACPGCGAVNALRPGVEVDRCAYCGGPLVPTEQAIDEGLREAERAERAARIRRYRTEREGIAKVYRYGIGGYTHLVVAGPFALMLGGGAVGFSVQMIRGSEPFSPAIFVVWALFFGLVAGVVGYSAHRRARRERWQAVLATFAAPFAGRTTAGLDGTVSWLDRYWAGPYDLTDLYCGPYGAGAELGVDGFAAYLYADPVAASQYHRAKVHLLLAAWLPGISGAGEAPPDRARVPDLRALLEADGELEIGEAGLKLALDAVEVALMRRQPEALLVHGALPTRMAALARALGGVPVRAID